MMKDVPTLIYLATVVLCSLLPRRLAFAAARRIGALRYRWTERRQPDELGKISEIVSRRVRATRQQANHWLARSFELSAMQDVEDWLLTRLNPISVEALIQIEGIENLATALEQGRGAILVGAHFMGVRLFLAALILRDYPVVVRRPGTRRAASRTVKEWWMRRSFHALESLGCRVFYLGGQRQFAVKYLYNALKRNEVVVILADMDAATNNLVDVEFVNQTTRMDPGSAILAATTPAPLLPFWVHRPSPSGPSVAVIGPPLPVDSDYRSVVKEQARTLEAEILRDPSNWSRWLNLLRRMLDAKRRATTNRAVSVGGNPDKPVP